MAANLPGAESAMQSAGIAPATAVFESLSPDILAIDPMGIAQPRRSGRAEVRISSPSGAVTTTVSVDVEMPQTAVPTSMQLRSAAAVMPGGTVTLLPHFNTPHVDRRTVRWSSSNESIATVDANGVVTGISAGRATITVTVEGTNLRRSCTVTVTTGNGPESITLNRTALSLRVGQNFTFQVTYRPTNAQGRNVTWISSDEAVARITPSGQVTAVGGGQATITAVCDLTGIRAACVITVTVPVTGVTLNPTEVTLRVGQRFQAAATVNPFNASNREVRWSSNNTRVATVDEHGNITAVGAGSARITVTTVDGGRTATIRVTVQG
jgi:uncharacterized protein YjdB